MALFDIFRRRPPIRDTRALADFIDQNAAFITQKGIYEYSRARAGHYAKVLFREPEFQTAADHSRWRAYPLGLAMVSELVEGVLCVANATSKSPRSATSRWRYSIAILSPPTWTIRRGARCGPNFRNG